MYKTILATAYAINPYKGSEDGMGWNFVRQIARFNTVIAITRKNNQPMIEKYMTEYPDVVYENMQFLYFDLPYWMRFWKKKSRGAMLYYWMWQRAMPRFIRKQQLSFDIIHNLNFHNDWTPSYLWKLNKPFVWGPIGHHPSIPGQYLINYNNVYNIKNKATWMVKQAFWKYSSSLKKTLDKADYVCCMNSHVAKVIPLQKGKYSIIPSVASQDFGYEPKQHKKAFTLISAGRFVPLKGFDLSILAFARFLDSLPKAKREDCKLIIVGAGPEFPLLQKLVRENNIENQVQFIHWVERKELLKLYKNASAFLFPSHEGAGMVVAEALSFGLPVICLDNSGPGEFIDDTCGVAVKETTYTHTLTQLSQAIAKLYQFPELAERMGKCARIKFENQFHWDRRGEQLHSIYQSL
ncbi:glycosyltransferase [Rapidithrix thailandica]|uniref:Glycosyltransferase n=1 Tax=Rapidithrix thailandica TaxID=413964 RepID=A0AAW9SDS4_9BACT